MAEWKRLQTSTLDVPSLILSPAVVLLGKAFYPHCLVPNAVVTPSRKATSYEPCIAILGIWGDTWITRGKYGIYGAVTGSTCIWRLLPRKISPIYCLVSYVAVTRIPSLVLCNACHYVIICYRYGELPTFVVRCSYEAALRKGVTAA